MALLRDTKIILRLLPALNDYCYKAVASRIQTETDTVI